MSFILKRSNIFNPSWLFSIKLGAIYQTLIENAWPFLLFLYREWGGAGRDRRRTPP